MAAKTYKPDSFVTVVCDTPVAALVSVTDAPGSTAFWASDTWPVSDAVPDWAYAVDAVRQIRAAATARVARSECTLHLPSTGNATEADLGTGARRRVRLRNRGSCSGGGRSQAVSAVQRKRGRLA